MLSQNSITRWINATRAGDELAAAELWNRYFHQLMQMARARMSRMPRESYDEEDAAISTFRVLCIKLRDGGYPDLASRDELWQLMLKVLARKIIRRVDYESAAKRPSGLSQAVVSLSPGGAKLEVVDDQLVSAAVAEECEQLFAKLNDPHLEQLVLWKLDGYTNEEIASKMNRTRRTVQRMLTLIRDLWLVETES